MKAKEVKVRFAPSPTGHLHIGGARTALYNYLYARHSGGTFVLRIEDTDPERSSKEFADSIIEDLKWLGIEWDEGPVYQSKRMELYHKYAEELLEKGLAYRCYCTPEELEEKRKRALKEGRKPGYDGTCRNRTRPGKGPYAVRIKTPDGGYTSFQDILRGEVMWKNEEIDDFIIVRSNRIPTYNFTAVVDDALMGITHIIRGDDHIANTPKQLILYRALGFEPPIFAHIPLIVGPDRTPLSKRHGAVSIKAFREMGILPEAMLNYLARLGWGYGDRELFSKDELIQLFDVKDVNRSPATFDLEKLRWMNFEYMRKKDPEELAELVKPFLEKNGITAFEINKKFLALIEELKPRSKTLLEMAEASTFYFKRPDKYDEKGVKKFCGEEGRELLKMVRNDLASLNDGADRKDIENVFRNILERTGAKMVKIAQPVRLAITGKTVSPGIFEVIEILGVKEAVERIDILLNRLER